MARVCNGSDLPGTPSDDGKVFLLRTYGNSTHQVWDVTDPSDPTLYTTVVDNLAGTHKNFWECRPASPTWSPAYPGGARSG